MYVKEFIYLFSFAYNYTNKQHVYPKISVQPQNAQTSNATYMIAKLNLGRFNFTIIHIHLICLKFYEPKLGNYLKTRHRPRQTYRNAGNTPSLSHFKVGQKGDVQRHKVDNNKKAGTPQQLQANYCGPLDTEST